MKFAEIRQMERALDNADINEKGLKAYTRNEVNKCNAQKFKQSIVAVKAAALLIFLRDFGSPECCIIPFNVRTLFRLPFPCTRLPFYTRRKSEYIIKNTLWKIVVCIKSS